MNDIQRKRQRYIVRLEAMLAMARDDSIGGQQEVAQNRLAIELAKFAQFGFGSVNEAIAAMDADEETYTIDSMGSTLVDFKRGSPTWKKLLCYFSGMTLNLFMVRSYYGIKAYGPEELRSQVEWVYKMWLHDIEAGAQLAWARLDAWEQDGTTKRRFTHAYCAQIVSQLLGKEQERYAADRIREQQRSNPQEKEGLTIPKTGLIIACENYAIETEGGFRTTRQGGSSSSSAGRAAGRRDAGNYSSRRMASGQKRLS